MDRTATSLWERFYRWQYPLVLVMGQILGLWLFAVGAALIHKTMQHAETSRIVLTAIVACCWMAMMLRSDWRAGCATLVVAIGVVIIGITSAPPDAWTVHYFAAGLDWRLSYSWLTHVFLHRDWTHLVNNLFCLLTAAGVLTWCGVRLSGLGIIAVAALAGDLLAALCDRPDVHLIGISGIAYGLSIAAALRSFPTTREQLLKGWHLFLLGVSIWGVGLGGLVPDPQHPQVSYQAHIGGTVGGVAGLLVWIWWQRRKALATPSEPAPEETVHGRS